MHKLVKKSYAWCHCHDIDFKLVNGLSGLAEVSLWPLRLGWLFVPGLYLEDYLQMFKCVSFWLHSCCGEVDHWACKPVDHASWVTVVTPTDPPWVGPQSFHMLSRVLVAFLRFLFLLYEFSVGVGAFVIRLNQISSLFSCCNWLIKKYSLDHIF